MLKRILFTVESCLDIVDSTYIECFMNHYNVNPL